MTYSSFDQIRQRIMMALPVGEHLSGEIRSKLERLLQSAFEELNILTRDQFQAQSDALARAEQRIAELEEELQQLEVRLETVAPKSD